MEKYKISVIVPVYNGGGNTNFIHRQVDSVLNQTYKNIELILVNDGSTDDSLDICNNYKQVDDRVIVLNKPNGGESSARNAGIHLATGEYVSVIDQDDELDTNMYADMMSYAESYNPDIIKCNFKIIMSTREKISVLRQPMGELLERKFLEDNVIPYMIGIKDGDDKKVQGHWTMVAKRALLQNNNIYYEESLLKENDHRFMVTAFAFAQSAVFCEGAYYHWIKRSGSHTSDYSPRFWNFLNNFKWYESLFGASYDFNSPIKIQYNVNCAVDALEYVIYHRKDCKSKEETTQILQSEELKKWCSLLEPKTEIQHELKKCVESEKYSEFYHYMLWHVLSIRLNNLARKLKLRK